MHLPGLGPEYLDENSLGCHWYILKPGVSYLDVTPVVLQHLLKMGRQYAALKGKQCSGVGLWLYQDHPAYQVVEQSLPRKTDAYAWYMRVPDLPTFLKRVATVLETRMENSWCSGHTGRIGIDFLQTN
jgi:hypothetical protein